MVVAARLTSYQEGEEGGKEGRREGVGGVGEWAATAKRKNPDLRQ